MDQSQLLKTTEAERNALLVGLYFDILFRCIYRLLHRVISYMLWIATFRNTFSKCADYSRLFWLVKLVNSNRVNCVKHWVLCKLFDPQTTAMSSCGNFAIVGDANGNVDMFNIQSGIHRGSLGEPKGLFDTPFIHHISREETALQWLAHGSRGLGWRAGRVIVQCSWLRHSTLHPEPSCIKVDLKKFDRWIAVQQISVIKA